MFENISGHKASVEIIYTMAKDFESDVWICDTEYAEKQYGFNAEISLTDGISKILKLENYN
jgi:hypothetical protein